jgi:ubiquinone biosynthesis protein COQ9
MHPLKDALLNAALPHVTFDGWTDGMLARAARQAGCSDFDLRRTFPRGTVDAAMYYAARTDARMLAEIHAHANFKSLKIRERIAFAVMARLRLLATEREAVRRTRALFTLPWHVADGLKTLYATVDTIWAAAGDTSTDYNFYTKRLLLAHVLTSTTNFWLDDHSENMCETEAFLARRIDDVMQIEKLKAKAKGAFADRPSWFKKPA